METNINDQSNLDVQLSEPHFDEEATLMTARPVVPLDEVEGKQRGSKRVIFIVSLAIALVVGSLAGAAVYKYRNDARTAEREAVDGTEQAAPPLISAGAGGIVVGVHADEADDSDQETEIASVDSSSTGPIREAESNTRVSTSTRRSRRSVDTSVADDDRSLEIRRAERREARRRRRQAEKQARRDRENSDDLLRIREIFEGTRRP